ncbi:MiaB/RimO family radical SAM methylthiotransferase [Patescibacteria group bacterium]|nr:MiaB/RimO family radical SAM methylthiotransferase [Patescibacteria group bacterium]
MKASEKPKTNLKYYLRTFGCQMNVKDSENMAGVLEALGFTETNKLEEAAVAIINTCSVRQASEDKVYGYGIKYKDIEKKDRPLTFITGCMIGSAKGKLKRYDLDYIKNKIKWADYFLAPQEESQLPQILYKEGLIDEWGLKTIGKMDFEDSAKREKGEMALINISYGCDNFCTFCVVPYARGTEISRDEKEILKEVEHAVMRGYSHIMLLGQNVNSWMLSPSQKLKTRKNIGKHPFASLLKKIHKIEGVSKISFITSNPWDFTPELVETLALPKIERFLHLPVQSGSNKILKAMNRKHTVEDYLELIADIKKQVPEMEFGTDVIVGFCGETNEDFEKTVELFKQVKFKVAFISKYSTRKGTPAEKFMKDDVTLKIKNERHRILMKVFEENKK